MLQFLHYPTWGDFIFQVIWNGVWAAFYLWLGIKLGVRSDNKRAIEHGTKVHIVDETRGVELALYYIWPTGTEQYVTVGDRHWIDSSSDWTDEQSKLYPPQED